MKRLIFALLVCGTVLALYTSMTVRVTATERVGSIMTYNYVKMNKSGGTSCKLDFCERQDAAVAFGAQRLQ